MRAVSAAVALTMQLDCRVGVIVINVVSLLHAAVSRKGALGVHIDITLQEKVLQVKGVGCGALLVGERASQPLACGPMQLDLHLE